MGVALSYDSAGYRWVRAGGRCEIHAPQIEIYEAGSAAPSESVTPGNDYELVVRGCGYEPARFAISVPPIELEIMSADYSSDGVLTVDFDSSGANVAVTTIGGFAVTQYCTHRIDGQPVRNGRYMARQASFSAHSMTAHEGDFGVARLWVGVDETLCARDGCSMPETRPRDPRDELVLEQGTTQ